MQDTNNSLNDVKKEIEGLNLGVQDQVNLWLVYRKIKPSAIGLTNDSKKFNKVVSYLGLVVRKIKQGDSWQYGVARNQRILDSLWRSYTNKNGLTQENNLSIGLSLGYPKLAVKEYSSRVNLVSSEKILWPESLESNSVLYERYKNKKWIVYVQYITRKGYDSEDVKIAIKWWKCVSSEWPELDKKYNQKLRKAFASFNK